MLAACLIESREGQNGVSDLSAGVVLYCLGHVFGIPGAIGSYRYLKGPIQFPEQHGRQISKRPKPLAPVVSVKISL